MAKTTPTKPPTRLAPTTEPTAAIGTGAAQPGATQPGATQPGATQPGATQPGATQPGADGPAIGTRAAAGLATIGVLWLAGILWSAHLAITSNPGSIADVAAAAALVLPSIVTASLVAGAAVALYATGLRLAQVDGRGSPAVSGRPASATGRRAFAGAVAGAIVGGVAAGAILLAYGTGSSITTLATTVGLAGVLGGAVAALPRPVLTAGVLGSLGVILVGVVIGAFQSPIKSVFGARSTIASQVTAATWLSVGSAVGSGLVAAAIAYTVLRRRGQGLAWPYFAVAGAAPGLLLLLAEGLTTLGGFRLFRLVGQVSASDQATLAYVDSARLNQALTVTFVGAIASMLAVGRTLRRPPDDDLDAS